MLSFIIGLRYYPLSDSKHYKAFYLEDCRLLADYIRYDKPIPVSTPSERVRITVSAHTSAYSTGSYAS
jgi:hypothetical protein